MRCFMTSKQFNNNTPMYSLFFTKNAPPNRGTTFLFYPSSLPFSQANAAKLAHTKMNVARALAQAALGGRRPWALVPSRSLTLRLSKAGAANRGLMHMSSRFWQKRPYILAKILTSFFCSLFDGHFNWHSFWLFLHLIRFDPTFFVTFHWISNWQSIWYIIWNGAMLSDIKNWRSSWQCICHSIWHSCWNI